MQRVFLLGFLTAIAWIAWGCRSQTPETFWLIMDQDADPRGGGNGPGAVFAIDPDSRDREPVLFGASELWRDPCDLLQRADGSYLLLDYYLEGGVGKIFRISKDGKETSELPLPEGLVDPFNFEWAPDGSIYIVDKNADPLGLGKSAGLKTGTLWRLDQRLERLEIVATGPPLMAPAAVFFLRGEPYLMDADSYQTKLFEDEGAIFRVRHHPQPLEVLVRLKGLVSPLGLQVAGDGSFLIVDVNADPVAKTRIHGAVYRVDPEDGSTSLFANHQEFRDPVTAALHKGGLLVVDANADPLGLGDDGAGRYYGGRGRGAIFRVDLETKTTELVCASKQFINPVRLRIVERAVE